MSEATYLGAREPVSVEQVLESLRSASPEAPRARLFAALSKAQGELGGAKKRAQNSHLKNHYARLEDVIEAIRPVFAANGLGFTQVVDCETDGDVMYGMAITTIFHSSGECIEGTTRVPVAKRDAHGVGGAQTYAKRYGLQSMAGLPSEDDDGEAAMGRGGRQESVQDVQLPDMSGMSLEELKGVYAATKALIGAVPKDVVIPKLQIISDYVTKAKKAVSDGNG